MICITLPDGSKREFAQPVSVAEVAADIGSGLAKSALAGKIGVGDASRIVDLSYRIEADASLAIVTGELVSPLRWYWAVIAAFGGWNDAGEGASGVIDHLADAYHAELEFAIDPEEFYDFQVNRPTTRVIDGQRVLEWPTTEVLIARLPERDLAAPAAPTRTPGGAS